MDHQLLNGQWRRLPDEFRQPKLAVPAYSVLLCLPGINIPNRAKRYGLSMLRVYKIRIPEITLIN